MSGVQGAAAMPDVPLSVTAVSARLGVSASTLRTWERRYGLGPGERPAGAHRRYLPEDVARLSRMVQLIRAGIGAGDAAASVLAMRLDALTSTDRRDLVPLTAADLASLARGGDPSAVRDALDAEIDRGDLMHAWSRLIAPTLDRILSDPDGDAAGSGAVMTLVGAVADILGDRAERPPAEGLPPAAGVVVLSDLEHMLPAHVVGVSLGRAGVPATVLATDRRGDSTGARRFEQYRIAHRVSIAVVMGAGATCEKLLSAVAGAHCVDVVLVGADAPAFLDLRVQRVRTLTACVEETVALARATAAAAPAGEGGGAGPDGV